MKKKNRMNNFSIVSISFKNRIDKLKIELADYSYSFGPFMYTY